MWYGLPGNEAARLDSSYPQLRSVSSSRFGEVEGVFAGEYALAH